MIREKVGEMFVDIKGRTDDIQRKMTGVQTKMQGLKQTFATFAKFVAGAYVAHRVVNAFKSMIKGAIDLGLQIDKMSKQTGMTAIEIQRLSYAAEQTNVSFQSLSNTFPILSQYMVEAYNGMGTYVDAFDRMKISVKDAEGNLKSAYDVMLEMSDYIRTDAAPMTEKLGNVKKLLGRRGADLIPLFVEERKQLELWGDEAEAMAGTLTDEMVKALVIADRNMKELTATTSGLKIQLGVGLVPQVDIYVKSLSNLLRVTSKVRREKLRFKDVLVDIATLLGNPIAMFFKLKERMRKLKETTTGTSKSTTDYKKEVENLLTPLGTKNKKLAEQIKLEEKEIALLDTMSGATRRTGGEFRSLAEIWAVDTSEIGSAIGDISNKTKDWSEQTRALGGILASVFQKGKMDAKGFLNMMLSIGVSFIPGGGFLKGFLGALRFGEGGSFIPRAAQGLVTAPSMSPGGAIINDNPKTVPETVLTSQELQQLIYGVSHPTITIHNANPETYAEALINIPESIKYKLARFMSDEILNKTEALNE